MAAIGLGACQVGEDVGPLAKAIARVANNTGRTVAEANADLRKGLPTAAESILVVAAEREAVHTDWIAVLAGEAPSSDAVETARDVHDATCQAVTYAKSFLSMPPDEAIVKSIRDRFTAARLTGFENRLAGIDTAIRDQVQSYLLTGKFDAAGAAEDLGCWF